jgi:hypothetical protein
LAGGFFACDVEKTRSRGVDFCTGRQRRFLCFGHRTEQLKQQRRFADSRFSTDEHAAARNNAAAQNAIEFADRHGHARDVFERVFLERPGACRQWIRIRARD